MLDKRKVEVMTRLAFYEQTEGKEDFKVSEYYRRDYSSLHTICSILWVTIGYLCLVAEEYVEYADRDTDRDGGPGVCFSGHCICDHYQSYIQ